VLAAAGGARGPVDAATVDAAGRVASALRSPGELTVVDGCLGPHREVPCVRVVGGVTCPRCQTVTPVVEPRTGPRLPECHCFPALCAHWALARVASR